MKFLLGTVAHNAHIQNIALALHEVGLLGAFYTSGVQNLRHSRPNSLPLRKLSFISPFLNKSLANRQITAVPNELVHSNWRWEGPRLLARKMCLGRLVEDWFWEKSEYALDRQCARLIKNSGFDYFFGVEHGALSSILSAKHLGKKSVIAFLSPHHKFREKWVDSEYEKFPELLTGSMRKLLELGKRRDRRRDEETRLADAIHANSSLTAQSLVESGIPRERIVVAHYGAPPIPTNVGSLPLKNHRCRFLYSGPVSVRKGAHYLLRAWKLLAPKLSAELNFYGINLLPERVIIKSEKGIAFHGSVLKERLCRAYEQASVLVFPTLCDGFGLVVLEAMAYGIPVITTPNAGASDLIEDRKNGFLVSPGDPEALAEKMQWCLDHPNGLMEMRYYALETARQQTWDKFRIKLRRQLFKIFDISLPFLT